MNTGRTIRAAAGLALGASTLLATGCEWSLAFESGSLDIVKDLLCPDCDKPPQDPNVTPPVSPGTSVPSDGGDQGDADPPEDDEEPEVKAGDERVSVLVGGRRWNVDGMAATIASDHNNQAVVAVSVKVSVAGVEGEATVFVPPAQWPDDASAKPVAFEVGAGAPSRSTQSMTIGGREYLLEFVSTTARVDGTPAGPRVRGVVEAHAVSLADAGKQGAKKQLVRLTFDADAE
jgi:hypothetical protein